MTKNHKLPSVPENFQGRFPVSVKSLLLSPYSDPPEKRVFFPRDFAARDLTCDKCPSSLYVWETRGKGRVLFFPLSSEKKTA